VNVARDPLRDGPRWVAGLILAGALSALVHGAVLWWPRTVDDAFIIYHYGRNLAEGLGPVYNPGERVEGYSSPLWMLGAAAAIAARIDPVAAAKAAGLACSVWLVVLVHGGLRRAGVVAWGSGLAALLVGSSFVLQIWSVSGLETSAYALALFGGLLRAARPERGPRDALVASAALACAALLRPEGPLFWLAVAPVFFGAPAGRWRRLSLYALPGVALAAHVTWRWTYYGVPLANTYYVKSGGGSRMWRQGLDGLAGFASDPSHLAFLAAAAAGLVSALRRPSSRRAATILALAILLHLLFVVSVGDDGLRVHRFYVPVLAPLAFLAGQTFPRTEARERRTVPLAALGALAVALAVPLSLRTLHAELLPEMREGALPYLEGNVKLGRHLAATRPPATVIAVAAAGAIPFYSRLRAIDMYGLCDATIAHGPFPSERRGRLMKWDNAYVLGRRPDLIAVNRGYFRAGDPYAASVADRPWLLAAAPLDRDLFERLARDGAYTLAPIRFEDGSRFYVFERRGPGPALSGSR